MSTRAAPDLQFCQMLPKCELHAHLNGSVRDSTLRELAEVMAISDSTTSVNAHQMLTSKGDA